MSTAGAVKMPNELIKGSAKKLIVDRARHIDCALIGAVIVVDAEDLKAVFRRCL